MQWNADQDKKDGSDVVRLNIYELKTFLNS